MKRKEKKMKRLVVLTTVLCFSVMMAIAFTVTRVEALTFDLNCIISGSGCAPSASFGTVTLTDNGNNVDITVDLAGSGIHKVMLELM